MEENKDSMEQEVSSDETVQVDAKDKKIKNLI